MIRQNWQMWSGVMDDNFIQTVEELAGEPEHASTFNNSGSDVRKSRVAWMSHMPFVKDMLFSYVDLANQAAFNVSVYNKAEVQYTEYHGSEGGHYSWHHDINWNRDDGLDRKLSITVQLSDPSEYDGGDFEFSEVENPDPEQSKAKGTVLIFPSYLQHAVSPVTSGVRKSLVAWFEGPTWR